MTRTAVEYIRKGITLNGSILYAKNIVSGRFREEVDLDIFLRKGSNEAHLLFIKIFNGRLPHYKPWIELYHINGRVEVDGNVIQYFDSSFETTLLHFCAQYLQSGESIFVDYYRDKETKVLLQIGIPPAVTRLGHKLFGLGFTWFKDWYFPEGFMEGEQKLQAEKPLNETEKIRQLKSICDSVKVFFEKMKSIDENTPYIINAVKRAHTLVV